jgi:hypothetical protein
MPQRGWTGAALLESSDRSTMNREELPILS